MAESLTIRNFGPIKEIEIPILRPLNVFVGPSGSGKSTIMKVLAAFQWLYKMLCIRSYLKRSGVKRSPFRFRVEDLLKHNGLSGYMQPDTEIIYRNESTELIYNRRSKLQGANTLVPPQEISLEKIAFISDKRMTIPNILSGMINIRHGLFYLEDTLENFMLAWDAIPSTEVDYLGVKFETKRTGAGRRIMVVPLSDDAKDYALPLHEASSGIQSVSAVHYIAEYFARHYDLVNSINSSVLSYLSRSDSLSDFKTQTNIGDFPRRRITLHIEEPELSLFPDNQTGLMEYLYRNFFSAEERPDHIAFQLNVATHSPYLVNHLNLMFKAAETRRPINGATLNFEDVNLFYLHSGVLNDMRLLNAPIMNTDVLSNTIENIYELYDALTETSTVE
ncbi:putative uncharacterized protein [Prevotella sp. CAG:485]|nr:putative uncharacterized protein [Prevotella sp. CAG:485]